MSKVLSVVSICLSVAVIILAVEIVKAKSGGVSNAPAFSTPYQAVLLDNGQVYYGKLSRLDSAFPEMKDVYYIVNTEDPQ
ncbi:MAG: hypothetical protein ACRD1I_05435, partial [Terriglobia bacterium]